MSVRSPELVMFDFDGTIADSLDVFAAAFADACAAEAVPGFERPEALLAVMETNFFAGMRERGIEDERTARVLVRLGRALVAARRWIKPFPLVPQVVEELGSVRTVVVVTSSPQAVVDGWIAAHDLEGVAEVAGAETALSKVDKIRALMDRFPGQETFWYVGDTAGDMREARLAGAAPLGVGWGWHEPGLLLEAGAERIVATPADLFTTVAPELAGDFFGLG